MRHTHFFKWTAYRKPYWKCSWNIQHILWLTSSFKQRDVGVFLVGFEGRWSIYYFFDSQIFYEVLDIFPRLSCRLMHQSIPPAPSPPSPGLLRGICPPCQSLGWGICKFCAARGPGICQPRSHSRAFDTHVVSYQNVTSQRIWVGKKTDWHLGHVKACSWFYACISSLLIKPELHSEIGSYRRESTFFGYWIKFLLILFEEHPFIFIKLFITYNITALY